MLFWSDVKTTAWPDLPGLRSTPFVSKLGPLNTNLTPLGIRHHPHLSRCPAFNHTAIRCAPQGLMRLAHTLAVGPQFVRGLVDLSGSPSCCLAIEAKQPRSDRGETTLTARQAGDFRKLDFGAIRGGQACISCPPTRP